MVSTSQDNESTRNYEIGYLIAPTVPEDEAAEIASKIQEAVTDADGSVLADQAPEARDLAYTMEVQTNAGERGFERGQFGWLQFSIDTASLESVEDVVESEADVMRTMTLQIDEGRVGSDTVEEGEDEEGTAESED